MGRRANARPAQEYRTGRGANRSRCLAPGRPRKVRWPSRAAEGRQFGVATGSRPAAARGPVRPAVPRKGAGPPPRQRPVAAAAARTAAPRPPFARTKACSAIARGDGGAGIVSIPRRARSWAGFCLAMPGDLGPPFLEAFLDLLLRALFRRHVVSLVRAEVVLGHKMPGMIVGV